MDIKRYTLDFAGQPLIFEVGRMAEQANGAVFAQWGETAVLATCVMSDKNREGIDFFPLSVEFEERLYAAGFIKHNRFMKREGKPTEESVLNGRMIDRAIRPRFNHSLRREIQVIVTALSLDNKNNVEILGLNAASLALMISDIPWEGPIAALKAGLSHENTWAFSPSFAEQQENKGNLVLASTANKINMIESGGNEITESQLLAAVEAMMPEMQKMIDFQKQIQSEIGKQKQDDLIEKINPEIQTLTEEFLKDKIKDSLFVKEKSAKAEDFFSVKEALFTLVATKASELGLKEGKASADALAVFEEAINQFVHQKLLKEKARVDGRKVDEIRNLDLEVGILPRTHGSALFKRGQTQALSTVTLGGPGDVQLLDGMETLEQSKRYFHHYNFLPFSTGEVKRMSGPGRRDIGHGHLAEKALVPVLPDKEVFPYTIRVVSEILSSNGSSSMASTCGSSLALMDAGVPLKKPVAGIALGLMMEGEDYQILTDIQGPEDHYGDMDLKVAGTEAGITAIQMDVKIEGISQQMLAQVLEKGKQARLFILDKIKQTIAAPRPDLSPWAPRIYTLQINPDKIRAVIGAGGKVINNIIDETGVTIDIEDSGLVVITSKSDEAAKKAIEWIKNLTHEVKTGELFQGRITRLLNFGAFAEILPGQEGLIHISELANYRVAKVEDVVKIGDIVPVKVKNIDDQGRINLSLKDALNGENEGNGNPK